jgi:hypothetical protein
MYLRMKFRILVCILMPRGQFFKAKLAPTHEVGAYASKCVGASWRLRAKLAPTVFFKNWPPLIGKSNFSYLELRLQGCEKPTSSIETGLCRLNGNRFARSLGI